MPRGWGTSLWRRTVPAMALSLVLLVVGADVPAASGNAPRPASPWGGVARNPGTPKRTERSAGPAIQPAASVRPQQVGEPAEWVLSFHDEFDGTSLDKSKWSNGFGWGQDTNSNYGWCDPGANVVSGGVLVQRIDRRPKGGEPFSVGCINSKKRFAQQFGYWEARIRTARCAGSRSAFWGKPNDESWPPEAGKPAGGGPAEGGGASPDCGLPVRLQSQSPLPTGTGEASGAVASQRYPGLGWFIRDSGNPASLYAFRFDAAGVPRVREVPVTGATNRDWEDLVYWMRPDGGARLLIPESGQGGGDTSIYEVPDPAPLPLSRREGQHRVGLHGRRPPGAGDEDHPRAHLPLRQAVAGPGQRPALHGRAGRRRPCLGRAPLPRPPDDGGRQPHQGLRLRRAVAGYADPQCGGPPADADHGHRRRRQHRGRRLVPDRQLPAPVAGREPQ